METKHKRITKQMYVEHLNSLSPPYDSDEWIIGGKPCMYFRATKQYGKALREHDPVEFEIRYNEYCKSH